MMEDEQRFRGFVDVMVVCLVCVGVMGIMYVFGYVNGASDENERFQKEAIDAGVALPAVTIEKPFRWKPVDGEDTTNADELSVD